MHHPFGASVDSQHPRHAIKELHMWWHASMADSSIRWKQSMHLISRHEYGYTSPQRMISSHTYHFSLTLDRFIYDTTHRTNNNYHYHHTTLQVLPQGARAIS
jgi:hypothetical protein